MKTMQWNSLHPSTTNWKSQRNEKISSDDYCVFIFSYLIDSY